MKARCFRNHVRVRVEVSSEVSCDGFSGSYWLYAADRAETKWSKTVICWARASAVPPCSASVSRMATLFHDEEQAKKSNKVP